MTERVLGPTGSARRRRFLFVPLVVLAVLAALFVSSAQAVHDLGLLELDRNVQNGAGDGDDWANLYPNNAGQTAAVFTFVTDNVGDGNQFQAGGSKDNNNISQWLWKAGEPLDKDDITNAYAAGYVNDTDTGVNNEGDFIVYFGLDRLANNGSAQVGFWFFKSEIGLTNNAAGGGFEFSGAHQVGDVLIQSNFSQGGVVDSITAFKWVGANGSHGTLDLLFSAADCIGPPDAGADDPVCATVNRTTQPAPPWSYAAKFPDPANPTGFPQGSFFEGGINLTRLVPGIGCISTFLAETRSSTPFDARLKDFARGNFNTCRATVTTQATPDNNSVTPGSSVSDSVTVTGTSLAGGTAPVPTGTVDFFLCQPADVTAAGCPTGSGTKVGDTKTLVNGQATSDGTTTTTAIGKYCWRAVYTPAAGSPYATTSHTNALTAQTGAECFTTVAVPTTTTTRQFVYPQDTAKVSATGGGTIAGSFTFKLYDDATECANDTGAVYTEGPLSVAGSQVVKTDNKTYKITDGTTHYWRVFFDSTNPAQLDSDSGCTERTTVTFLGNDTSITIP